MTPGPGLGRCITSLLWLLIFCKRLSNDLIETLLRKCLNGEILRMLKMSFRNDNLSVNGLMLPLWLMPDVTCVY